MIVSIEKNRYQIFISTFIGFLFYYKTRNENVSIGIVIVLTFLLRKIKIDEIIKKKLKQYKLQKE